MLRTVARTDRGRVPRGEDRGARSTQQYRNMADGLKAEPRAVAFAVEAMRRAGLEPKLRHRPRRHRRLAAHGQGPADAEPVDRRAQPALAAGVDLPGGDGVGRAGAGRAGPGVGPMKAQGRTALGLGGSFISRTTTATTTCPTPPPGTASGTRPTGRSCPAAGCTCQCRITHTNTSTAHGTLSTSMSWFDQPRPGRVRVPARHERQQPPGPGSRPTAHSPVTGRANR